jgi:hypothetical protein
MAENHQALYHGLFVMKTATVASSVSLIISATPYSLLKRNIKSGGEVQVRKLIPVTLRTVFVCINKAYFELRYVIYII